MEAFIESGRSKDRLFELLGEIDEVTRLDDVMAPHEELHITVRKDNNRTLWKTDVSKKDAAIRQFNWEGANHSSLCRRLDKVFQDTQKEVTKSICVLAVTGMKPVKTFDGKYQVQWAVISPGQPYEVSRDGQPAFDTITLTFNKQELACCSESGIALYDEIEGIVYPIRECAFPSIGKLLGCAGCFKFKSDYPVGSALILAENLANTKGVRLLLRNGSTKFRPLIGLCGPKYQLYSQKDMVTGAWDCITEETRYLPHTDYWKITEERTIVDVKLATSDPHYDFIIQIQSGDIPGTSLAVSAYAQFGEARVLLRRNTSYHWESYQKNGGVKALFKGIFDAINDFADGMGDLNSVIMPYSPELLSHIYHQIGSKRAEVAEQRMAESGLKEKTLTAAALFRGILEATYFPIKEKQAYELTKAYSELFHFFCGDTEVTSGPASEDVTEVQAQPAARKAG